MDYIELAELQTALLSDLQQLKTLHMLTAVVSLHAASETCVSYADGVCITA